VRKVRAKDDMGTDHIEEVMGSTYMFIEGNPSSKTE
jgi:hypothetical protein